MQNILHSEPIQWEDIWSYSHIVLVGTDKELSRLEIALQNISGDLWMSIGGYDDITYPQTERTVSTMKKILEVLAHKIKQNPNPLQYVVGKLLKESIDVVRNSD